MPNLYVIAGCNGAGKTTTSYTVLPEMLNCKEFVNADEIARGLSPFQPETVSFQAGRIMLDRIKELIESKKEFGFETTLATRSYVPLLKQAEQNGYTIVLFYFWLESIDLAKSRVLDRVKKGGHNIPPETIERRYKRGLANFFNLYKDKVHTWVVYDNSKATPYLIAKGGKEQDFLVQNSDIWKLLDVKND